MPTLVKADLASARMDGLVHHFVTSTKGSLLNGTEEASEWTHLTHRILVWRIVGGERYLHAGFKASKWKHSVPNEVVLSRNKALENLLDGHASGSSDTENLRVRDTTRQRLDTTCRVMNSPGRGRGTQSSCRKGNS